MKRALLVAVLATFGLMLLLMAYAAADDVDTQIEELVKREDYNEALLAAEKAAEGARRAAGDLSIEHLKALLYRANTLTLLSRAPEAGKIFEEVARRLKQMPAPDTGLLATTLSNMAVQRRWMGQMDEAARLAREAVVIAEQLDESAERHRLILVNALMNLGVMLRYQSQAPAALLVFQRALPLADSLTSYPSKVAELHQNIASAREDLGEWIEARANLTTAFEVGSRTLPADHTLLAALKNRIGINFYLQRQFHAAQPHFREAYQRQERSRRMPPVTRAAIMSDYAKNNLELGHFPEARRLLENALGIRQRVLSERHPDIARTLSDLAEITFRQGQINRALTEARKASEATISTAKTDLRSKLTLQRHIRVLWASYERDRKSSYAVEAFRIAQFASRSDTTQTILRMATRLGEKDERIAAVLRRRDDKEAEIPALEAQLTAALALPVEKRSELYAQTREHLRRVEEELGHAQAQLEALAPNLANLGGVTPLEVADVASLLKADQVLVKVLVGYQETFIWAITTSGVWWAQTPLTEHDVRLYVNELRRGLTIELEPDWSPKPGSAPYNFAMAHDLYTKIFGGVADALLKKTHLLFVPTGPFTALPPHVLVQKAPSGSAPKGSPADVYRNAAWLARAHAVSIVPSVPSLKALVPRAQSANTSLLGFGDPIFNAKFVATRTKASDFCPPRTTVRGTRSASNVASYWRGPKVLTERLQQLCQLPEGRRELEKVSKSIGEQRAVLKFGVEARESFFKREYLKDYGIVYFATHALVAGELGAGEPGIVLTVPDVATAEDDGFLSASEIALKELDADWVVISACNTAAGTSAHAEGLSGLARSFFHAGARALLVTHWNVGTEEAEFIASHTFSALGANPQIGKAQALRKAMLDLMESKASPWLAHPANWAPFVIVEAGIY